MPWPIRPPNRLPQERIERRPERHRQPEVVRREGDRQRRHRVDGPPMDAPVVDGAGHAEARCRRAGRLEPERRLQKMLHRLRHPKEHQADAHPGGKQHREPTQSRIVRPGIRAAQANAAKRRHHQKQAEEYEEVARAHENPVERRQEPRAQRPKGGRRPGLECQYPGDECDDGEAGDDEDRIVDVEAENLDVVPTQLVVGLRDPGHRVASAGRRLARALGAGAVHFGVIEGP